MTHLTTFEIFRADLEFSSGHFTIFSSTRRERLHGHNFGVGLIVTGDVDNNGMMLNYSDLKRELGSIVGILDERFLLPAESPYLRVEANSAMVTAYFGDEILQFPATDVCILPISNVTLEELSRHICTVLIENMRLHSDSRVREVTVRVSSRPGQDASYTWSAKHV